MPACFLHRRATMRIATGASTVMCESGSLCRGVVPARVEHVVDCGGHHARHTTPRSVVWHPRAGIRSGLHRRHPSTPERHGFEQLRATFSGRCTQRLRSFFFVAHRGRTGRRLIGEFPSGAACSGAELRKNPSAVGCFRADFQVFWELLGGGVKLLAILATVAMLKIVSFEFVPWHAPGLEPLRLLYERPSMKGELDHAADGFFVARGSRILP